METRMQSENVMLKAVWCIMQDQSVGSPMNNREHKKQGQSKHNEEAEFRV